MSDEGQPCAWCMTLTDTLGEGIDEVYWRAFRADTEPYMVCRDCLDAGVWAVGPDGDAWSCGQRGDLVPHLVEGWSLALGPWAANRLLSQHNPGTEGMTEPKA